MHANSRPVTSSQPDIHRSLIARIDRHAASRFRKPIAPYNREAFEAFTTAWDAAGHKPLILDSGCGVGLSTARLATRFPDHFAVGVDQSADRLARRFAWPGALPANFMRVRADLVDFWRLMQDAGIHPQRHFLLYPNPWPKAHHLGRRWHAHPVFPTVVALGGRFECRSNWRIYIEECAAVLNRLTGLPVQAEPWAPTSAPQRAGQDDDGQVVSPFEDKYLASGHALWRCRADLPATRG